MFRPVPRQFPLSHEATAIAIAADGKRLAAAAVGLGRIVVYDVRLGRVLFRLGCNSTALAFLPDGTRLVSAWSEQRRSPSPSRPGSDGPSSSPTSDVPTSSEPMRDSSRDSNRDSTRDSTRDSSRDSNRESNRESTRDSSRETVRVGDEEARRSVRVWDLVTGRCLTSEPWFGEAPIAISPDGRWLAAAADRVTTAVLVLRASDGALERILELPNPVPLRSLSFSPDGAWLVAATGISPVMSWSTEHFTPRLPDRVRAADTAVAFSVQGEVIAAADADCRVRLLVPGQTDAEAAVLTVRHGRRLLRGIDALSFSPDDALVVARGRTGATQVFSREQARPLWTASPGPLAFLPDGKTIAAWWCGAIWLRDAESGDLIVGTPDDPPSTEGGPEGPSSNSPKSRTVTLRSGEPDVPGSMGAVRVAAPIAPVISEDTDVATIEAATSLISRLSTTWAESTYRQQATLTTRDPDGLGVRLPLRGGFAYVKIRPRKEASKILVQVLVDEPDVDPPPSSSLVRFSRWIRDRLSLDARRQAAADREWAAELAPDAADGDVRIERGPGSLTISFDRALLPSIDDIEALVHKAEQKLAS